MDNDTISFFSIELIVLIIIIIVIPLSISIIFWYIGFSEIGIGVFGAVLGSLFTLIGSYYTNYNNKKAFLEEKKFSENMIHYEHNLEKQRDATIEINKKITEIIVNSEVFKNTMQLHEFNTMDEVILFFLKFEKNLRYDDYFDYYENYFEYMIQEIGEDIYTLFKKEMRDFEDIIYLPQVLKEEILYWTNNYNIVYGVKRDLKDNAPYFRFDETHYYPNDMTYKSLYTDLKIICAIIWRDTNSFLFNNIKITSRNEIQQLFKQDLNNKNGEIYKYVIFNKFENDEYEKIIEVNLGEKIVKDNIFKELFGELYSQFENRINY